MGGEQAAGVLVRVRSDAWPKKGNLSDNEAAAIAEPILDQFAQQSDPFMLLPGCGMTASLIRAKHVPC